MARLPPLQTVVEREADIKHLKEQLTEAKQANEASRTAQASQNQSSQSVHSSDANAAAEANQAQQEELAKLRQEVSENPTYSKLHSSQTVVRFPSIIV